MHYRSDIGIVCKSFYGRTALFQVPLEECTICISFVTNVYNVIVPSQILTYGDFLAKYLAVVT